MLNLLAIHISYMENIMKSNTVRELSNLNSLKPTVAWVCYPKQHMTLGTLQSKSSSVRNRYRDWTNITYGIGKLYIFQNFKTLTIIYVWAQRTYEATNGKAITTDYTIHLTVVLTCAQLLYEFSECFERLTHWSTNTTLI